MFKISLSNNDKRVIYIALLALVCIRLLSMYLFPLVDNTEARYAEIARKMLESGNWITPQFDYNTPFWGKPPLHTWLSAIGMALFGVNELGARILIFLCSLAVLHLSYDWVKKQSGNDSAALICVTVLASSALFFGTSAYVQTDMVLMLGTTLSMVAFYNCVTESDQKQVFWGYLFFVGLAIGLLAKGPIALVLTGLPLFLWVSLGGRWRLLAQLPIISGTILMVILTLPWYALAEQRTPGFLNYFIVGEHFYRFTVPEWQGDLYGSGHARPKGLIWLYWLAAFLPWTFWALSIRLKNGLTDLRHLTKDQDWISYLMLWAISAPVIFTVAANILVPYVLPSIPALAILLVLVLQTGAYEVKRKVKLAYLASLLLPAALLSMITVVSIVNPNALRLKSERELVSYLENYSSNLKLSYFSGRSFSAEFYSRGSVHFIERNKELELLSDNNQRDAVAVYSDAQSRLPKRFIDNFEPVKSFGRRTLYIELNSGADS